MCWFSSSFFIISGWLGLGSDALGVCWQMFTTCRTRASTCGELHRTGVFRVAISYIFAGLSMILSSRRQEVKLNRVSFFLCGKLIRSNVSLYVILHSGKRVNVSSSPSGSTSDAEPGLEFVSTYQLRLCIPTFKLQTYIDTCQHSPIYLVSHIFGVWCSVLHAFFRKI